ncbi:calexcitin-2 [Bombyx mori]|uniref:EF-hand domain-containing protein n=1 Tax=Bombyx mori TaxID=7091 RepID=A0A8R1WK38_BOMMO|nr:calexcitin-2 [Bombyx mori]
MVSDFRKKKLLLVFQVFFDTDKSGTIEKSDFEKSAEGLAKARGWAPGSPALEVAKEHLTNIWNGLQKAADIDGDGKITQEEWLSLWDKYAQTSTPQEWQDVFCKSLFHVQDSGGDGAIDAEEYSTVQQSFGIDKAQAVEAFKKMAQGKDVITWAEYQTLFKEYFTSDDPNALGNCILGQSSF